MGFCNERKTLPGWQKHVILGIFISIPLFYAPILSNQHFPKICLVLALLTFLISRWVWDYLHTRELTLAFSWLRIFWILWWLFTLLSTTRYVNGDHAIERMLYLGMMMAIFLWSAQIERPFLVHCVAALCAGGTIAAIYGLWQSMDTSPLHSYPTCTSTFGNVNFAASHMAIILLLLLIAFYEHGRLIFVLRLVGSAIVALYLIRTGSRAAWIGTVGGILMAGICWGIWCRRSIDWRKFVLVIVVALSVFAICWTIPSWRCEIKSRLYALTDWDHGSVKVRIHLWSATWDMWQDHICLGVGAGQFWHHFYRYRHEEEYMLSEGRMADDPHNMELLLLAESGSLGAITFAFVVIATYLYLARLLYHPAPADCLVRVTLAFLGICTAFIVTGLFCCPILFPATAIFFPILSGYGDRCQRCFRVSFNALAKIILTVIVLSVVIFSWHTMARRLWADVLFGRGQRLFSKELFAEAGWQLDRAVKCYPDGFYQVELGRAFLASGNYFLASEVLRRAIATNPGIENAYVVLGLCYLQSGQKLNALQTWQKGCELFPYNYLIHNNLAKLSLELHQPRQSIYHLWWFSSFHPQHSVDFWLMLGHCHRELGDYRQAVVCYLRAQRLKVDHPLAQFYIRMMIPLATDKSQIWYEILADEFLKEPPATCRDYFYWGIYHELTGNLGQAWTDYNRAVQSASDRSGQLAPERILAHLSLALLMQHHGLNDAALNTLQQVIDSCITCLKSSAYFYVARIYEEERNYPLALSYYQKSLAMDRGLSSFIYLHLAQIAFVTGQKHLVLDYLEKSCRASLTIWRTMQLDPALSQITTSTIYRKFFEENLAKKSKP